VVTSIASGIFTEVPEVKTDTLFKQFVQNDTSISAEDYKKQFKFRNQILPVSLIVAGVALEAGTIKEDIQEAFPRTNTDIDDYLQWAPAVVMYSADIFTSKHKNNVFNQTKYLLISELATAGITQILKKATHVTRPNGGDLSFPSGHTSNAFANATVLFHEYRDYNNIVAGSGYLFATTTGILRITNNRHWITDVLAGAGIGILITNIVYYIEPFKDWDPFRLAGKDKLTILPDIDALNNSYCMSIRIKF
jgi:hypothetical protein